MLARMPSAPLESAPPAPTALGRAQLDKAEQAITTVVRGNAEAVRMLLAAILARGHVLLEDVPGVGKTTLARATARVLGCTFRRIQFTADLLPSDVIGVQILDREVGELRFKRGPIFSHLVLADEINRASPKTQSALLEAMSDQQVSVDDVTYPLEAPFSVIATQNPIEHHGAYPLPESQLDRFMVRLTLGYPPAEEERALLVAPRGARTQLEALGGVLDPQALLALQGAVDNVSVSGPVADYCVALAEATRRRHDLMLGCSPRGTLAWVQMARAVAFCEGRDFVLPDDIKALARPVLGHRIVARGSAEGAGARHQSAAIIDEIVAETPVPR
jgi:MoxR-like ATPase